MRPADTKGHEECADEPQKGKDQHHPKDEAERAAWHQRHEVSDTHPRSDIQHGSKQENLPEPHDGPPQNRPVQRVGPVARPCSGPVTVPVTE